MNYTDKIYRHLPKLTQQANIWKDQGLNIVFTNGVFDLIHKGHIAYLSEAKQLGDKLIVGINSDMSTKSIKGPTRPINDEESRLSVVAAMQFVDAVILFDEETPKNLIEHIKSDVLVKGGDYKINEIVGADFIREHGGEVKVLQFINGYSSTHIINKIIKNG